MKQHFAEHNSFVDQRISKNFPLIAHFFFKNNYCLSNRMAIVLLYLSACNYAVENILNI